MDYRDYKSGMPGDLFWFKAKRRLIEILLEKAGTVRDSKILNIGAGTGEDISVIKKFGDVYVIDVEPEALNMIPEGLVAEKLLSDARSIPYPEGFFDAVVAFDVLEHIEDDREAIKEILRVLKPGGLFLFTVPAFGFLYSSHDKELEHFRRYGKRALTDLLSGLSCLELGYWVFSLFLPVALQRLLTRNRPSGVRRVKIPGPINAILYRLLGIDNLLIKHNIPLPFGTTIYGIFRKA